jgi:hypothetical protein
MLTTLELTTLGSKQVDAEVCVLARYVESILARQGRAR